MEVSELTILVERTIDQENLEWDSGENELPFTIYMGNDCVWED